MNDTLITLPADGTTFRSLVDARRLEFDSPPETIADRLRFLRRYITGLPGAVVTEGPPMPPPPDGSHDAADSSPMDHPGGGYSAPDAAWVEKMVGWRTALATGPLTELRLIAPPLEPGGKPIRRAWLYPNDPDGIRASVIHALELERTPGAVVCEQTQCLRADRLDVPRLNKRGKPTAFTSNSDVARRTRLVIDIDPITTDGGTSRHALKAARIVRDSMSDAAWPEPVVISSGRGIHLLWAVDEPVDDGGLVGGLLLVLDEWTREMGGTLRVKVDPAMANPCQIRRIPGVVNYKTGRRSRVLRLPERLEVVSTEQLQALSDSLAEDLDSDPRRRVRSGSTEDSCVESDGSASDIFRRCPSPETVVVGEGGGSTAKRLYVEAALRMDIERLEAATTGERRNTLFAVACAAIELLNSGFGDPARGYRDLFFAARALDLDDEQIADQLRGAAGRVGTRARDLSHVQEVARPTIGGFDDDDDSDDDDEDQAPTPDGSAAAAAADDAADAEVGAEVDRPEGGVDEAVAFPVDVFPEILQAYCQELAGAMAVAPDIPALAMLTVAGAAIGQASNLEIAPTWTEGPLIYGVVVAETGVGKTAPMRAVVEPLAAVDSTLRRDAAGDHAEWTKASKAKPKKGEHPVDPGPEPPRRAALASDCTKEALTTLLHDNPRGLLCLQDESLAWLNSMDAYRGKGGDRQFWLSAYNSVRVTLDRKQNRESLVVDRPFVALLAGCQPSLLHKMMLADGEDGMCDRMLFAYPSSHPKRVWKRPTLSAEAKGAWDKTIRSMAATKMREDSTGVMRPWLCRMTPAADALFGSWYDAWNERALDEPRLRGAMSKGEAHCLRLSLILSRLRLAVAGEPIAGRPPTRKPGEIWPAQGYGDPPGMFRPLWLRTWPARFG